MLSPELASLTAALDVVALAALEVVGDAWLVVPDSVIVAVTDIDSEVVVDLPLWPLLVEEACFVEAAEVSVEVVVAA